MKSIIKVFVLLGFVSIALTQQSCGFYKFSGTSICQEVETFSVAFFENNASIVNPLLSQNITEQLKQKFISETNLSVTETEGDFSFSGTITNYTVAPISAQSDDNASMNRLTISVEVKLVCPKCPESAFEQTFTNFQDFDAAENFSDVEEGLIEDISDMLVQSIFNKAAINW